MGLLASKDTNNDKEMAFDFHFPTSKKALLIFTRNPELGKVKTRLAKTVGNQSALDIYNFLIQHTVEITKDLNVDKFVFYSDEIRKDDAWDSNIFRKRLQSGNDLGERMQQAFEEILCMGYQMAIIIGSDMFNWKKSDLGMAFDQLSNHSIIIGPATDGGYYLMGMKELHPQLFKNKKWGSDQVLQQTIKDLSNVDYILLEERNDVDIYEDIMDEPAFQKFFPASLTKRTS